MNGDDERDYDEEAAVRRDAQTEGLAELAAEVGHMSGPAHYREAERIYALATRENDRLSRSFGPVDQITAEQRAVANIVAIGHGHAALALAAATAMNIRRNGAVEAVDEAAGWERVLG